MSRVALLRRPAVRYFGGKWVAAPWIVRQFPPHRVYVEPYGGGASVLLRKPPAEIEVLNDLDDRVVALYRVLADPELSRQLGWRAYLTPYRKSVFKDLKRFPDPDNDLDKALRLITRGAMSRSSSERSGYRPPDSRPGRVTSPYQDWVSYKESIPAFHRRLRDVRISQVPALDVMREHDGPDALHYVDPPYVRSTRKALDHRYRHELSDDDQTHLLEVLRSLSGLVVLSGYPSRLYDEALEGWTRIEKRILDNSGERRVECLWLNPACAAAGDSGDVRQLTLF